MCNSESTIYARCEDRFCPEMNTSTTEATPRGHLPKHSAVSYHGLAVLLFSLTLSLVSSHPAHPNVVADLVTEDKRVAAIPLVTSNTTKAFSESIILHYENITDATYLIHHPKLNKAYAIKCLNLPFSLSCYCPTIWENDCEFEINCAVQIKYMQTPPSEVTIFTSNMRNVLKQMKNQFSNFYFLSYGRFCIQHS